MKNLLKIILLTIITSFIFSSCGKHMSITKRKYNKGYYVSHTHKRPDVKSQPATAEIKNEQPERLAIATVKREPKAEPVVEKEAVITAAVSQPAESNEQTVNTKSKATSEHVFNKKFFKVKQLDKLLPSKFYTEEMKKKLSADSGDDALSLLWIIILVILILYVIGLAMDGFGLGWAIHILALVALILLILWLLRIL